jgi:leucyl-tRNA synthetase
MPGWAEVRITGCDIWMRTTKPNLPRSPSLLGKCDLYIGGSEHATGHLLYLVLEQILKRQGFAPTEEPFKKLINQGMILGTRVCVNLYHETIQIEPDTFQKIYWTFRY